MTSPTQSPEQILNARVRIPEHVVYRPFATEIVVLNLNSGKYHGLNPSAGRMLEALEQLGDVQAVCELMAAEFNQPLGTISEDLCELCIDLLARGLIEVVTEDRG